MNRKWLRIALPILCLVLAQCTASTTTSPGPPTAFATVRLNATTGTGDQTFGPNKTIVVTPTDPALNNFAAALAIQADSKIVVGGSNGLAGQGEIALIRYNSDGSIDSAFGIGGIVTTPLAAPASATSMAIEPSPSNKIVVAALTITPGTNVTSVTLLRYNPDGSLDTTGFASPQGSVNAAIGPGLPGDTCALVLQSDGKILAVGAAQDGTVVLYRYDSAGVPDPAFGTNGKATVTLGANASVQLARTPAIALQSDGRIIVAARSSDDQAVMRFNADGTLDTGFGPVGAKGIVITDIGSSVNWANAVAIQDASASPANTDKIVVAGHTNVTQNTSDISLVRYTKDGVLDTSGVAGTGFGTTGIVTTDINGQFDNAFAVVLQDITGDEPKILVSGNTGGHTVVLRYNKDGSTDATFGSAGIGQVSPPVVGPSTFASGNAIAIQPGFGIVITGYD